MILIPCVECCGRLAKGGFVGDLPPPPSQPMRLGSLPGLSGPHVPATSKEMLPVAGQPKPASYFSSARRGKLLGEPKIISELEGRGGRY